MISDLPVWTHVGAGCGVWGGRSLCRSTACGWRDRAASCSSPSPSPSSPPGRCKSEEGRSPSAGRKEKKKLSESLDPSVDEWHCRRDRWEHAVLPSLTANHPPAATAPHLDVDQQLPQAPGWHHCGGVELGDVALVQSDVVISRETLEQLFMSIDSKVWCRCVYRTPSRGRDVSLPSESRGWCQQGRCLQSGARERWSARSCHQGRCQRSPPAPGGPSEGRKWNPRRRSGSGTSCLLESAGGTKHFLVSMGQLQSLLSARRFERSWTYLRYIVVTIDADRGRHQHRRQHHQTQGEAAQTGWELLLGTGRNNQLFLEGQTTLIRGQFQEGCGASAERKHLSRMDAPAPPAPIPRNTLHFRVQRKFWQEVPANWLVSGGDLVDVGWTRKKTYQLPTHGLTVTQLAFPTTVAMVSGSRENRLHQALTKVLARGRLGLF